MGRREFMQAVAATGGQPECLHYYGPMRNGALLFLATLFVSGCPEPRSAAVPAKAAPEMPPPADAATQAPVSAPEETAPSKTQIASAMTAEQDAEDERSVAELRATVLRYQNALLASDIATLSVLVHPDYGVHLSLGKLAGTTTAERQRKGLQAFKRAKVSRCEISVGVVSLTADDTAQLSVDYEMDYAIDGKPVSRVDRVVFHFAKYHGEWKFIHGM